MTVAILQARMTSARLPKKVLMDLGGGKSVLWHIIDRLRAAKKLDDIVLAIPDAKTDDILEEFALANNVHFFRGSGNDVLARYYEAAKKFGCDTIVRVTADNPLVDPEIIDLSIVKHQQSGADYTSNKIIHTFPWGLDVEVISFATLEKAHQAATESYQKEHVTIYIYEHPEIFKLESVEASGVFRRPELRLTVDTPEDWQLMKEIYNRFYQPGKIINTEEAIIFLDKHPEVAQINIDYQQRLK